MVIIDGVIPGKKNDMEGKLSVISYQLLVKFIDRWSLVTVNYFKR